MSFNTPTNQRWMILFVATLCVFLSISTIGMKAIAADNPVAGKESPNSSKSSDEQTKARKLPVVMRPVDIEPSVFPSAYERIAEISAPGSEHMVSLDVEPLKTSYRKSDRIQLWLGSEIGTLVAKRKANIVDMNGVTAWRGNFRGNKGFVNLVFNKKGRMIGTIWHEGKVYEIKNIVGTEHHVFYQVDPEIQKKAQCGNDEAFFNHQQHVMDGRQNGDKNTGETVQAFKSRGVNPAANTVIDVLVCYSAELSSAVGDVNTYIASLISATNGFYTNSDVTITMNLRGTQQISYPELDDAALGTALSDIANGNAQFSGVAALRNSIGADLVVWLQRSIDNPVNVSPSRVVGIAYRPAYGYQIDAVNGFSVTARWYDSQAQRTFAHEIGHNMTLAHSWAQNYPGVVYYAYGWGHYFGPGNPNVDRDYGTIMTYAGTKYPYFSNPNKQVNIGGTNYDVGKAISGAYTDEAEAWQALNNIRNTIASYKPTVSDNSPPENLSVVPSSGSGANQQFQFEYSDPDGASDLKYVYGLISTSSSSRANAVYFRYNPATNQLSLRNDANSAWSSATMADVVGKSVAPAAILSNSQVSIDTSTASVSSASNILLLTFTCNFKAAFAGAKNVYMYSLDDDNESDGWEQMGTYNALSPNSAPTITSLSPTSGSESSQTFVAKYTDADGTSDLRYLYLKIADSASANGGCVYLRYRRASNKIEIRSNAGGSWTQVAVVGTSNTITNSQGSVDVSQVTVSTLGNTLTLSVPIDFREAFAGPHNLYMNAFDMAYATPGWTNMGTFTANAAPTNQSIAPTSGTGAWKTFDCYFEDKNGTSDLRYLYFKMSPDGSTANAVYIRYRVVTSKIDLRSNAGGSWIYGPTIGTSTTIKNSQVKINCANVTATAIGDAIRLRLPLVFRAPFNGAHKTYMYCTDAQNEASGWEQMGTFTVSGATAAPATDDEFSFDIGKIKVGDTVIFPKSNIGSKEISWSMNGIRLDVNNPVFTFRRQGIYNLGLSRLLPTDEREISLDNIFVGEKLVRAGDVLNWEGDKKVIKLKRKYEKSSELVSSSFDTSIIRISGRLDSGLRIVFDRKSKEYYQFLELRNNNRDSGRANWILGEMQSGKTKVLKKRSFRKRETDGMLSIIMNPSEETISFFLNDKTLFRSNTLTDNFSVFGYFGTQKESLDIVVTEPEK